MENVFMSAGVVVTIVLCLVGIIKSPFDSFKSKHPQGYKTVFTTLSFILGIGLAIVDELFILNGRLLSLEFAILVVTVIAGVFGGYNGIYEGLGLKTLMKKIGEGIKKLRSIATDKKVIKFLDKIQDIDNAIAFLEEKKNNQSGEV